VLLDYVNWRNAHELGWWQVLPRGQDADAPSAYIILGGVYEDFMNRQSLALKWERGHEMQPVLLWS
jgi:hypothetical protein